jgi:hypothetical protein
LIAIINTRKHEWIVGRHYPYDVEVKTIRCRFCNVDQTRENMLKDCPVPVHMGFISEEFVKDLEAGDTGEDILKAKQ